MAVKVGNKTGGCVSVLALSKRKVIRVFTDKTIDVLAKLGLDLLLELIVKTARFEAPKDYDSIVSARFSLRAIRTRSGTRSTSDSWGRSGLR
mmetsp:Transcript_64945/g.90361  ORF Transcript_64945/g.90361 Transcript_64945/m.90361 type:complete len:92 (-) Transcript_64945:206-481(-)